MRDLTNGEMAAIERNYHLTWCKQRALEYLPADPNQAFLSMVSDLRKFPELENHCGLELGLQLHFGGFLSSLHDVRTWIEGFN